VTSIPAHRYASSAAHEQPTRRLGLHLRHEHFGRLPGDLEMVEGSM
jgi:hypothetical protein